MHPLAAIPGGRVTIHGRGLGGDVVGPPELRIGELPAQVVYCDRDTVVGLVPRGVAGGAAAVRLASAPGETAFLEIGAPVATGLHQVDSPVFGADGTLFLTYSGARGDRSPVSVFRLRRDGFREPFVSGVANPTSLACDPNGRLFVSSRFDGTVYSIDADGRAELVATDLGVACGLAFDADGRLFVGDRSGTVYQVSRSGKVSPFAVLPPSVAAFHLAIAPTGALFVTAPTLSTRDALYRVDRDGTVTTITRRFGRPQGLAFDTHGVLYVAEALAGASGLYRVRDGADPEFAVAAQGLVGVAFDTAGAAVVVSGDTAYRFERWPPVAGRRRRVAPAPRDRVITSRVWTDSQSPCHGSRPHRSTRRARPQSQERRRQSSS